MKMVIYLGRRVSASKSFFSLVLSLAITTANAQTIYLSTFPNPTGNYNYVGSACAVGLNTADLASPSSIASATLTDYANLTAPGGLTLGVACSAYSLRTKINLGGLTAVPASASNKYFAGIKVSVSSLATLNLLGGNNGNNFLLKTYQNGTLMQTAPGLPVGLGLLQPGVPGNVDFEVNQPFNEVQIEIAAGLVTLGAGSSINVYYAYASSSTSPIILPVKLTSFTATAEGKDVQLSWNATSELNLSKYEVEKSNGQGAFISIGSATAKGNSSGASYSFTDKTVVSGESFYRLKIVDRDGSVEYSKTISITNKTASKWKVYPTILGSGTDVNVVFAVGNNSGKTLVQLANLQGQTLRSISAMESKVAIPTNGLAAGIYIVKLYNNGQLQSQEKIVVQ